MVRWCFFAPYWSVSIAPLFRSRMRFGADAMFLSCYAYVVLLVKLSEPEDFRIVSKLVEARVRSMARPCHFSQAPVSLAA